MSTKRRSKGTQNSVTPPPPATSEAGAETTSMEASAPKKRTRKSVTPPPGEVKPRTRRSKRPAASTEPETTLFDGITPTPPPPVDLIETPAPTPAIEAAVEAAPVAPVVEPPPPPVVERVVEKVGETQVAKKEREDEISVPPVSSDLDEAFFESKPPPPNARVPMELEPTRDLRMEQLTSPAAHARRAQLAKYVKAVVGVSLVVCFLAFVRVAIQRNHSTPQVGETSAMAATSPPAQATPAPATKIENEPEQAAQPAPQQPADTPPEAADSRAGLGPVPNPEPTASAPASPDEPVTPDPAEAKKEKHKSHIALEQGKTDESIQHGELAVKLDPTDGEAWLILGAAYQSKGNWTDARRCYRSCLTEGKRGPRGECSAMLR